MLPSTFLLALPEERCIWTLLSILRAQEESLVLLWFHHFLIPSTCLFQPLPFCYNITTVSRIGTFNVALMYTSGTSSFKQHVVGPQAVEKCMLLGSGVSRDCQEVCNWHISSLGRCIIICSTGCYMTDPCLQ